MGNDDCLGTCPHSAPKKKKKKKKKKTTLLTYGAIIVLGGAAIGLLLYLLATTSPNTRYANAYGQSYGQNSGYSSYNRRMFNDSKSVFNFDLLGLVNKAVEVYQQLNGEED